MRNLFQSIMPPNFYSVYAKVVRPKSVRTVSGAILLKDQYIKFSLFQLQKFLCINISLLENRA
jgi:hypothetical protein